MLPEVLHPLSIPYFIKFQPIWKMSLSCWRPPAVAGFGVRDCQRWLTSPSQAPWWQTVIFPAIAVPAITLLAMNIPSLCLLTDWMSGRLCLQFCPSQEAPLMPAPAAFCCVCGTPTLSLPTPTCPEPDLPLCREILGFCHCCAWAYLPIRKRAPQSRSHAHSPCLLHLASSC